MVQSAYREQVLVNEARSEMKGSLIAMAVLWISTAFLAFEFWDKAHRAGMIVWLAAMLLFLLGTAVASAAFLLRPPGDHALMRYWVPGAKAGVTLCNVAIAASVWLFMPVAGPELRATMIVLYTWYTIIQFVAASEATQMLGSALVMVLGSLCVWLAASGLPYSLALAAFLPLFAGSLLAIRRFVRQAVVKAAEAHAAAEAARRALDIALSAVARERDAKTRFIQAASHDLQQPLQAAALFLDRVRPGDQAAALSGVRQSLGAARALVGTMLDHLKLEGGAIRAAPAWTTAGAVFERALLTQRPQADAAGIAIRTVGESLPVFADPALLARALENLVANALRHSGGALLLVGARVRGGTIVFRVIDDGRGLAPDERARIFAPFEQGRHVGASGGFGLGLASTRGLAALMDGSCDLEPAGRRGAAFSLTLPRILPVEAQRCAA